MQASEFQSSPGPKAECYWTRCAAIPPSRGFNPHPARRPSATFAALGPQVGQSLFQSSPGPKAECYLRSSSNCKRKIKFQSSPGPKAECYRSALRLTRKSIKVSILTRPEGRVLLGAPALLAQGIVFQSSPGPKAECYKVRGEHWHIDGDVSILTRPEGRVLHYADNPRGDGDRCFNPHPARRPSATSRAPALANLYQHCFNPHPARRPSATYGLGALTLPAFEFQSSPGPKAECYARQPGLTR